jgi:hypothetical protein
MSGIEGVLETPAKDECFQAFSVQEVQKDWAPTLKRLSVWSHACSITAVR